MSTALYQKKFESEKRKAFVATLVLDCFLIFYFFFMLYFFSLSWNGGATFAAQNLDLGMLKIFGVLAALIAFIWGWWGRSPGVSLIYRTNRYLKGSLRDQAKKTWWQKPYLIFSVIVFIGTFFLGFQIVV